MSATVTIDAPAAAFEAWAGQPAGPVFLHMAEVGHLVQEHGKSEAPEGKTGELRKSIEAHPPHHVGSTLVVDVVAGAPYAYYVHQGTRPHVIEARPGGVLAWEGPNGPAFARRVNHPGTAANPFLVRGLEAVALG